MIRPSDLAAAAGWARPAASSPSSRSEAQEPSRWFDGDAVGGDARISGDLGLASRGLSVEQHAARVLACLCGDDVDLSR